MTYDELPEAIKQEFFSRHDHLEDGTIVYTEKDVFELIDLMVENEFLHKVCTCDNCKKDTAYTDYCINCGELWNDNK